MWTRKDLKERARAAVKRNYWKAILTSMVFILLVVGILSSFTFGSTSNSHDEKKMWEIRERNVIDVVADIAGSMNKKEIAEIRKDFAQIDKAENMTFFAVLLAGIIIIVFVIITVVLFLAIFIAHPLHVGASRFMLKSTDGKGNVAELGFAFDNSYVNVVKTTAFCSLHIFLWTLLFIVPGIYKRYQYYMVNYILAEYPNMPRKEVLERSKNLMRGQKCKTFVLDFSFIRYHILGIITLGLAEIFYIKPYICMTRALLYRTLANNNAKQIECRMIVSNS